MNTTITSTLDSYAAQLTSTKSVTHFNYCVSALKEFCLLKQKHQIEYTAKRDILNVALDNLKQDIMEEGISIQKLNACRVIYEKSLEADEYQTAPKSIDDIVANILDVVYTSFGVSNNSKFVKSFYEEHKTLISMYYTTHYNIKKELKILKTNQDAILSKLRFDITENGVWPQMISFVYSRFVSDKKLDSYGFDNDNIEFFNNVYNEMKVMLEESKNV